MHLHGIQLFASYLSQYSYLNDEYLRSSYKCSLILLILLVYFLLNLYQYIKEFFFVVYKTLGII